MKRLIVAAALAVTALACAPAAADITVKDAAGASVTTKAVALNGVQYPAHVSYDASGTVTGTSANPFVVAFPAAQAVTIPGSLAIGSLPALPTGTNAIGSVTVSASALPAGAATATKQDALLAALGTPLQAGGSVTAYLPQLPAVDRGGTFGTSPVTIMAANANRRFIVVRVLRGGGDCFINGTATASADYHSMPIYAGEGYESSSHVGTAAISIVCTAAGTSVFAREG